MYRRLGAAEINEKSDANAEEHPEWTNWSTDYEPEGAPSSAEFIENMYMPSIIIFQ